MFDVCKEVPCLELCKRLKDLGYPQGDFNSGGWYWVLERNGEWEIKYYPPKWNSAEFNVVEKIKAPTVRELGEWLPDVIFVGDGLNREAYLIRIAKDKWRWWYVNRYGGWLHSTMFEADTEADLRAKVLIWLVENGYVKLKKKGSS